MKKEMKKEMKNKFNKGDRVRLKLGISNTFGPRVVSTIQSYICQKIYPGGIFLSKPLDNCEYWSEDDLEKVK